MSYHYEFNETEKAILLQARNDSSAYQASPLKESSVGDYVPFYTALADVLKSRFVVGVDVNGGLIERPLQFPYPSLTAPKTGCQQWVENRR
jgi:hypothetical protein